MRKRKGKILLLAVCICMGMFWSTFNSVNVSAKTKISKKKIVLIKGQKKKLFIKGTKKKVKWSSSRKSVAAVSRKGIVKAKKRGTAVITARVGANRYKCKVRVETPSLSKKTATVYIGTKYRLKLNGNTQKIKWKSSNTRIASVSKKGYIKGKKTGNAVITARISSKSYSCKVTVKKDVPKFEARLTIVGSGSKSVGFILDIQNNSKTDMIMQEVAYLINDDWEKEDYMFLADPKDVETFIDSLKIKKKERWRLPYLQAEYEYFYTDKNSVFYFQFKYRSKIYWGYVDTYGKYGYVVL